METIALADYIERNPGNKRLNKRVARAIKAYRHSIADLDHALEGIARAKADCAFGIQAADQFLEDCHSLLEEWALPDTDESAETEVPPAPPEAAAVESETVDAVEEDDDVCASEEVEDHLRHAAKDIGRALEAAESALTGLDKVEGFLFDIIELAEADGFAISPSDARAHLIQKSREAAES